ncbi:hypothetical protein Tco_0156445 [Tanacetum coccineum]
MSRFTPTQKLQYSLSIEKMIEETFKCTIPSSLQILELLSWMNWAQSFRREKQDSLPALEQAQSQSQGRKRKHLELEPEIRVPGLECNRTLPEKLMLLSITSPKNIRFCLKLRKMIVEHLDQEKLKSKRVKLESVGYKLD